MRIFPLFSAVLIVVAVGSATYRTTVGYEPAVNPDLNHTHADFAIWINGEQLDFSAPELMSGSSTDASTHPEEGNKKYLHLHDGNGHVVHRHKPGMTFGDFLASIGVKIEDLGATQYKGECVTFPQDSKRVCSEEMDGGPFWQFRINGKPHPLDAKKTELMFARDYIFNDGDKLLLTFSKEDDPGIQREVDTMTDDACKYSKTCPWKGAPPTENCIADPTVPCVGL